MIPIHALLNRIRWDPQFGQGEFAIGYYDRVLGRIVVVPFAEIRFEPGDHFAFECVDAQGAVHAVPLHRVREVYRDGQLIWRREG